MSCPPNKRGARRLDASHISYEVHEAVEGDRLGDVVRGHLHNGFDLVVAAGGDGTVSGVVDGLVGSSIPLCIIPTGTGNLIARELGISTTLDEAVALIGGASGSRRFDAMRIGDRIFILNVRRSRYLAVAVDGIADEYRAIEVSVMNCGMVPKVLYSKGPTIRDYPSIIFNAVVGRPFDFLWRFIKVEKRATIRSNVPLQVQADGDIVGTTPIDIEVVPGAVTVLVPEEAGTAPIT